uniref:DNA-directed RNA polymerase subunit beta n=1 Tax=Roya obtusa TaxID=104537 RepID=A0A191T6F1_9VIRI|nr:beta subunit of RNA polymerase [Roya obtusa]ANI25974.1 beta subunit of RNA polymerase [Roya obtusa]
MCNSINNRSMFVLPDFLQIQVDNFRFFLENCILEELNHFEIIKDTGQELEFELIGEQYRLSVPSLTEREAVYQSTTYAADLYVPVKLTNIKNGKSRIQTVCLGSIPLMTPRGTFVINGVSWTIVNQILRNPGIYYTLNRDGIYTGTILCLDSDKRLRLEIDKKGRLSVRVNNRHKVALVLLLVALGLEIKHIPDWIKSRTKKLDELLDALENKKERELELIYLYKQLPGPKPKPNPLLITDQIKQLCNNIYQLGNVGRCNLNKRLGLDIYEEEQSLLPQDLIAAADLLIKISSGIGYIDDIDHLKNKHVNSVADMLRKQLKGALIDLQTQVRRALRRTTSSKRLLSPRSLIGSRPLTHVFSQFFGSHELIQFLDQTNPLAEMAHKRKLSFLGPGGLTRRTASFRTRDIHPSHYGRICTIETSEGMNAGVISSLATCARVNSQGVIENPLQRISGNLKDQHTIYVRAGEDERFRIGTNNRLAIGQIWQERSTSTQYQQEFVSMSWDQIHFRSILPIQYFAIGASLIPFLEHNDANRALMGSNMQRQAVPLIKPEKPIVGTGLEAHIGLDSGTVLTAIEDGKIQYVDGKEVILLNKDGEELTTQLLNYERSNNGTCIHHRPIVDTDTVIRQGQLLADGAATVGGELALGKNVLVAYMPWEGYNFEDAVLISDRLVNEDVYTSIHIEKYEILVQETSEGSEIITREIPHLDKHVLRHLDQNGIVSLGSWVEPGDVLVGKLAPLESESSLRSPEGKLLQAIFGVQAITTRESCLKLPPGGRGRVIDIRWVEQQNNFTESVHVYVLQKRKIQIGDKVAGRHGNKGIVSKILPREDMPHLQDGTPIDMVLSPLGVPSRMNVGQLFECLLGLAGNFLNKHYRIMPFDERYERESSRKLVFSELYNARKLTGHPWLFESTSPGKSFLFDGRTGEIFDQPITVGIAYMMKLIHQVDDKIHARSSGPYALVTQQPLRGRSNRGGQRVGEMEVWAFEGFGAAYMLQEMLTIKSDHVIARSKVLGTIVAKDPIPKPKNPPDSFRLLIRELRCLGIEISYNTVSERQLITQEKLV